MCKYTDIKKEQPTLENVFFAFSQKQFEEGLKKHNLKREDIRKGFAGALGTQEGLNNMVKFYNEKSEKITKECKPQDVYNYEFINYECDYISDDQEAIQIVKDYFGIEGAKKIVRRRAWVRLESLD